MAKARVQDMTVNASYGAAKGSARVGKKKAPDQVGKARVTTTLQGWMDSRPANADRNQSAK